MRSTTKRHTSAESAPKNRLFLALLLAGCFVTGLRLWVNNYTIGHELVSIPLDTPTRQGQRIRPVAPEEIFEESTPDNKSKIQLHITPDTRLDGAIIAEFLNLQQQGIIPQEGFPLNPFREPNLGQDTPTALNGNEPPIVDDTPSLGRLAYDCAAHGFDSFTFNWRGNTAHPDWPQLYDIESKGHLFVSVRGLCMDESEGRNLHTLQFQTSDSCRMLRTLLAQMRCKNTGGNTLHAPEWADLRPDELQVLGKCLSIIRECVQPDMSDAEKAKALAIYLCHNLSYHRLDEANSVFYRHRGRFAIYALMPLISKEQGKAICEGYTKTYGLLLTLCGIPSMEVCGYVENAGYHAWNLVYLKGIGWYHVDTTWMDNPNGINYTYFLCTDDTLRHGNYARRWPATEEHLPYPATPSTPAPATH